MQSLRARSLDFGDSEEPCNKCYLPSDVILRQPSHLSLADHVHRLDTLNRSRRRIERAKPLTGSYPSFDRSVILLHDVVQVAHWPAPASSSELSGALEFCNDLWIGRISIYIDHSWTRVANGPQCLPEKAFGSSRVPSGRQQKVNRRACGIHRAV